MAAGVGEKPGLGVTSSPGVGAYGCGPGAAVEAKDTDAF